MENVYGIGVANRYALFLDEDSDPLDILKQSEAEVVAVEKVVVAARVVDVAKDAEPVEAAESHVENSASTRRLSPPWGNEETREGTSTPSIV